MRAEGFVGGPALRALAADAAITLAAPGAGAAQVAPPTAPPPASAPGATAEDVDSLRERAATFWAARIALDSAKQWELLEPRGRGRMSAEEYGGVPRAVKYLGYQVEGASVHGYFAKVKVRLIVQPVLPTAPRRQVAPAAVIVEDTWVRIRGTWYRSMEQEEGRGPMETRG
jgi:hypothetical protein